MSDPHITQGFSRVWQIRQVRPTEVECWLKTQVLIVFMYSTPIYLQGIHLEKILSTFRKELPKAALEAIEQVPQEERRDVGVWGWWRRR